jgi:hypothetical protein
MAAELTEMAQGAADCADDGDWEGAKSAAQSLAARWEKYDGYTHIIMHHDQIDATTDAIYSLLTAVCDEETGTAARAELVKNHIDSLASIERLRFGSIF